MYLTLEVKVFMTAKEKMDMEDLRMMVDGEEKFHNI